MARRQQRRKLRPSALPDAVILDAGALSGAAQGAAWIRAELSLAEQLGVDVYVSSVTLTETLRGHGRDARVHALLTGTDQQAVTPQLGRSAGELLGQTNRRTPSMPSWPSPLPPWDQAFAFLPAIPMT